MILAVVLQILGALIFVVAVGALTRPAAGVLCAGVIVFAAGFDRERHHVR